MSPVFRPLVRVASIAMGLPLLALASAVLRAATSDGPGARPNIVVILTDDMGYSDLGCFGSEIATPNIDALAAGGVRFTQFYNTGRCCPTRASLLTGLYQHQAGVGGMINPQGLPGYSGRIHPHTPTIAEALRPAGYRSYLAGKWHLTPELSPDGPKDNWPLQRGFDRFYGTLTGAGSFFDPGTLTRDNTPISPFADSDYQPSRGYYYTDAIADQAARFVRDHRREHAARPFFLYVAFTAPHFPLHARSEDIARQHGKYDAGFEAIRRARLERQKKLGVVAADAELPPLAMPWPDDPEERAWQVRAMEVYAAQIEAMDAGVGRLVAALRDTGALERTLIFYLHDNGGCAENVGRGGGAGTAKPAPMAPRSPEAINSATRPLHTRAGVPVRYGHDGLPGDNETYMVYGKGWAQVSNTPLNGFKVQSHEGGVATPLVVHWPAGMAPAQRGKLVTAPGHLVDVMATALDVAQARLPTEFKGHAPVPLAGVSLAPALQGRPLTRTTPIFFEHQGNRAIRDGDWKLVAKGPAGPWELYHLATDRGERHDLVTREPERARALAAAWEAWARSADAVPWPHTPAYRSQFGAADR